MSKKTIPKAVRIEVWDTYIGPNKRDGKCLCCNKRMIKVEDFDCGHVQSNKEKGKANIDNLRPICRLCNSSMGTKNMAEYMEQYGYKFSKNWHGIEKKTNNDNLNHSKSECENSDFKFFEQKENNSSKSQKNDNDSSKSKTRCKKNPLTTAQRMEVYENMKIIQDFDYILRRNDILIQQLEAL